MSSTLGPGKTSPKLLQDLLTYDPRYEERAGRNLLTTPPPHYDPDTIPSAAVPGRNCRHIFLTKPEQSELPKAGVDPNHETVYKVASFCQYCRLHLDLIVDFRDDGDKNEPCQSLSREYLIHHFLYHDDNADQTDPFGRLNTPRNYKFCCSAPNCPVELRIRILPPQISDQDLAVLTDQGQLRRRLETARQLAGERTDSNMARPVDALDFLNTYLQDSLNPKQGKSRIPLMNRKFLKTFGKDCDQILKRLGFTNAVELEDSGDTVEVWYLPKPSAASHPLEQDITQRTVVESALCELNILIQAFPEHTRTGVRHTLIPVQPSITHIQRALGCLDYDRKPSRETRSTNLEEDHPYFAGLGAVSDFSDALLTFAYTRQVQVDTVNSPYYFECLQDIAIGRKSEELGTTVMVLASQSVSNRREVAAAYKYFGIEPTHSSFLQDDHIIGLFKSRLQDIGPAAVEESRKQLRIIGSARGSEKIKHMASDAMETYEQALDWLDLDQNQPDDFVTTMYTIRVNENANHREAAIKAVQLIADKRDSQRLRDFLKNGFMDDSTSMDTSDAYAMLNINDRTQPLSLDVLQEAVAIQMSDNPSNATKIQQAYDLVCKDQKESHNNSQANTSLSPRKKYPLDSWPVGFQNIGNTCYLNSVLQFLFTIKPLRNAVLDPDNFVQTLTPEELEKKIVGRSPVRPEKLEKAQQFVHELRELFQHMITDSQSVVRPETRLAALALADRADPAELKATENSKNEAEGLGSISGMPIAGPTLPSEAISESQPDQLPVSLADSVMGDDDAKSDTSTTAMDLTGFVDKNGSHTVQELEPPSRPPPVPPRPQASTPADNITIKKIERNAEQQDAAEILNNIFDLLSCALKGDGTLRDGEQLDLIKSLFFTDLTTVLRGETTTRSSVIQDNHLISPGNRDRSLYAALDDEFSLTEVEQGPSNDTTKKRYKYEYIEKASPVQIINVRRLVFEGGKPRKDNSHVDLPEILYLDRYLKETKSLTEGQLLDLREEHWELQRQLRALETRKKLLRETALKVTLSDAVEEAAVFVENLVKASKEQLVDVDDAPIPEYPDLPDVMRQHSRKLKKEAEELDQPMKELDEKINSLFKQYEDHPYRLHAVFMHRGTASGGHYWIYIYDSKEKIWRKYNDEEVDPVLVSDVFEHGSSFPQTSTGIVYVRQDLVDDLTEAVHRNLETETSTLNEVEMTDAGIEYQSVQVIDGIEKQ